MKHSPGTCVHYTGLPVMEPAKTCKAGVCYDKTFDSSRPGIFLRMPCVQFIAKTANGSTAIMKGEAWTRQEIDRKGEKVIDCPHFRLPSQEELDKASDELARHMDKMRKVMTVVAVWRKKPPKGKSEVIACPSCGGRLHLSQASYNGHVHGKCETADCVSWME